MTLLYVGHPSCLTCLEATKILRSIQVKVALTLAKVEDLTGEIRKENRLRWEKFAWWCNLALIGSWYFRRYKAPELLPEPVYEEEPWFTEAQEAVQSMTEKMYELMALDKYRCMYAQPAYYKNPVRGGELTKTTLQMLITLDYPPTPSPEFDLVIRAREYHVYAMCGATYRIVPIAECDSRTIPGKTRPVTIYVRRDTIRLKPFDLMKAVLEEVRS